MVEIIREFGKLPEKKPPQGRIMSIDLGIDNLAAITTNTNRAPELIKGKRVKYVNQYYNKKRSFLISALRNGKDKNVGPFTSKRLV